MISREDIEAMSDQESNDPRGIRESAMKWATLLHMGQTRSNGDPYVTHPIRVAEILDAKHLEIHGTPIENDVYAAAVLHDTIEDTEATYDLISKYFNSRIASLVLGCTNDDAVLAVLGKTAYLSQKMLMMSPAELRVKLSDRLDNVQDLATAKTPKWRMKYKQQTEDIMNSIEAHRFLDTVCVSLIKDIRAKIVEVKS